MSNDFILAVQWYLETGWTFLTSFNLPGVNFTPAAALFMGAFATVGLKFLRSLLAGVHGRGGTRPNTSIKSGGSNLPANKG